MVGTFHGGKKTHASLTFRSMMPMPFSEVDFSVREAAMAVGMSPARCLYIYKKTGTVSERLRKQVGMRCSNPHSGFQDNHQDA